MLFISITEIFASVSSHKTRIVLILSAAWIFKQYIYSVYIKFFNKNTYTICQQSNDFNYVPQKLFLESLMVET